MRLIVAGSREIHNVDLIETHMLAFEDRYGLFDLICGMARGVDMAAHDIAESYRIPIHEYPAEWDKYGRGAGYRRNVEMAQAADALLLVWDGESRGSKHMLDVAIQCRMPTIVIHTVDTA